MRITKTYLKRLNELMREERQIRRTNARDLADHLNRIDRINEIRNERMQLAMSLPEQRSR